jgi:polyhydroxybutyrate depolymerase
LLDQVRSENQPEFFPMPDYPVALNVRLAFVLAAILACNSLFTAPARAAEPAGVRSSDETLNIDSRDRRFLIHDYSHGARAPLVILLHGGGGNPENAVNMTGFDAVAAREGLIAVYPGGTGGLPGGKILTWNATHCCAYAMRNKVDDVAFISAIIDRLVASGRADPARVYVTGMSNGGMMSHRLGRELSMKITAIAPVVGAVFGDELPPQGAMPAFIIVGAEDRAVPAAGGQLGLQSDVLRGGPAAEDRPVSPARAQADYWVSANGCRASKTSQDAASRQTLWTGCRSGADVVFVEVANNGHAWPGGRPGRVGANEPSQAYSASEAMWAFFKRQAKPRP